MILSKEELERRRNLDPLEICGELKNPAAFGRKGGKKFSPIDMKEYIRSKIREDFYDNASFQQKYGFDKRELDLCLMIRLQFSVLETDENGDEMSDYFDEQLEKYGDGMFKGLGEVATGYNFVALPNIAVPASKLMLLQSSPGKKASIKKFFDMASEYYKDTDALFEGRGDFAIFDRYKEDVIDKLPSVSEKLEAAAAYIFCQEDYCSGMMEKKAVDFFIEKSGFLERLEEDFTRKELEAALEEAEGWLERHGNPANFLDLAQAAPSRKYFRTLYKLAASLGVPFHYFKFDKQSESLKAGDLQQSFALLRRYPELYHGDEDFKEFLVCLLYVIQPLVFHLRAYTAFCIYSELANRKGYYQDDKEFERLERKLKKIDELKAHADSKQEQLNKLQMEYDKAVHKDIPRLAGEAEMYRRRVEDQAEKMQALEEMNAALEARLEKLEAAAEDPSSDSPSCRPNSYLESRLKQLDILVMGGHQIWQNRLKEIYPYFTFIDADNVNYDINLTRNADIVFFNTLHCSHTLYYKIKNNVNNGRTSNKEKLVCLASNNLGYFKEIVSKTVLGGKK